MSFHIIRSGWVVLLMLLAGAAAAQPQAALHTLAGYYPADQARFQPGAPAPVQPRGLPPAGSRPLRPGTTVFGWLPAWVPMTYARQVDFALVSHVAYGGYRATEQGAVQAPAADSAQPLAALVHRTNPQGQVLLSLSYHEPATGAALLEAAGGAARQALAQALAGRVAAAGANGVHLACSLRPRSASVPAPAPRPASKSELERAAKRHEKERKPLNDHTKELEQDAARLKITRSDFARSKKNGEAIPPADLAQLLDQQRLHTVDSSQHAANINRFRAEGAALEKGMLLPPATATTAGPDARPAALRELLDDLRRALPSNATLTLELPAVDSARVYAGLLALGAPPVTLCVLQPFDYTAALSNPGPLAPVQPSTDWGPQAVATSVEYYRQKLPLAQLLVGLATPGKVWTVYTSGAPIRSWYMTSRSLAIQPLKSQTVDKASGSLRVTLDSLRGMLPQAPYVVWTDDTTTLAARYAWVKSQGLGGVSIWALGFDAPDAPLWAYVRAHLAGPAAAVAPIAADTTAAPAADTTQAGPQNPTDAEPQTFTDAVAEAESWVQKSALAQVLLLVLAVLLAGAWVGMVVGAARSARYWVPFARRLAWMLALLLGVGALLGLYISWVGPFQRSSLWLVWLAGLGLLVSAWVAYRRSRPTLPLP
jgi:hypothetical protein